MRFKILVVMVLVLAFLAPACAHRKLKLTPEESLSVVRVEVLRAVRDVEQAHRDQVLTVQQYTAAKAKVTEGIKAYNSVLKRYRQYGLLADSEKEQVMALAAAVLKEIALARKKKPVTASIGGDPR